MKIQQADKIIFMISGGIGKNVMATAMIQATKKAYPKKNIIVITAWPEAWLHNPHVSKIINFVREKDFFKNINKENFVFLGHDPYFDQNFIYRKKHLIEIWCEMYEIPYHNEQPQLYFTDSEKEDVKNRLPVDKPLFFIQTSGGALNQDFPISWMRDMPLNIAQEIVNEMVNLGFRAIHLRREDQYSLKKAERLDFDLREAMCAIEFSEKRLFIDSFAQHAAAALNKPSVVTWVGNKPEIFGYKIHKNLLPKEASKFRHQIDSYLEPYNITGMIHECPYDTDDLFDKKEILENLK